MELKEKNVEKLSNILKDLNCEDPGELIRVWNDYCDDTYQVDARIYYYDDLDELFYGTGITKMLDYIDFDEFDTNAPYVTTSIYGYLKTLYDPLDVIDVEELAEWCLNHDESFNCNVIKDFFDELNIDNDEESEV